jgi:type I restriction enzyme M protein
METKKSNNKQSLANDFAKRLTDTYGYTVGQIGFGVDVAADSKADIAIWRSAEEKEIGAAPNIYVLVACKAEHIKIQAEDYFESYKKAALNDMAFYVAVNLKETKVFYIDRTAQPFKIERLSDFPKAADIASQSSISSFIEKMRAYSKDDFLKRLNRCHNIIRNNDKLSPEAAFDEISKILFVKMLYERNPGEEMVYSKEKFLHDEAAYRGEGPYIQHLFNNVKEKFIEDGLFDADDRIKIRRESLLLILEELGPVELYDTSDDIKGIAFELFLGKTFRGELGQFFTPRTVVNYMVDILDINEGDRVCDPCCGSGGFLIKAFEHIQNAIDQSIHHEMKQIIASELSASEKEQKINALLAECDKTKEGSRYYRLCHDYFFGVDANVRMARTAKMNMIMHGDGHVGVYQHDGLINVGGVFEDRFDVVLINPPFGAHVEKDMRITAYDMPGAREREEYTKRYGEEYSEKVSANLQGKRLLDLYEINSNNTEILFIERCINLLKPGKRAGIVLPEGVLDNSALQRVRQFVEKRARILNITSIPSDVFLSSGANIKPSLLFIQKYGEGETPVEDYELTITKVSDAGISSTGLPSQNEELPVAAGEVLSWLRGKPLADMRFTKVVRRSDLPTWSVKPLFDRPAVRFNPSYPLVKLGELLVPSKNPVEIRPEETYTRLTVKLFNKGVTERDTLKGKEIGTKRQTRVKAGQFVISKIDGKSAAFGIISPSLDGAIVTPDFMVYDIREDRVLPEYLQLVLQNPSILNQFASSSSGTTGRRRLSQQVFERTSIALPTVSEQRTLLADILQVKESIRKLETLMAQSLNQFNQSIFE